MAGTSSPETIAPRLQRVAKLAREMPQATLTTLAHHIDLDFLFEAYRRTRKDGAAGVDGQTAQEYAEHLEENLRDLLSRAKSGTYWAPPVRRVHIPKGDGRRTRPIGIPTFEDKVLQRAVTMVLDAVYEQDFRDCSYGFRPGRSAHQALDTLWKRLMAVGGGFVLELDIEDFFGSLDRRRLREILQQRVRDGVLLRLIGKWLHAGVLEDESLTHPEAGTPQGGVISPLLANVYVHEVLDALGGGVDRPVHHRRARAEAHPVRDAHDLEPLRARALRLRDLSSNAVDEDLGAAARNGVEPRRVVGNGLARRRELLQRLDVLLQLADRRLAQAPLPVVRRAEGSQLSTFSRKGSPACR